MITYPIFTLHLQDVGATIFQIGSILSIQSFLLIILRVPLTLIARRIGERKMLFIAFIVQSVTQLFYGISPSAAWFYPISILQVLSKGTFFQLATAINSNLAPEDKQGDALGRHMTIMSVPMFIGPVITGIFVEQIGYQGLFFLSSTLPFLGLIIFWWYTSDVDLGGVEVSIHETPNLRSLVHLFTKKNLVILALIRALYSTSNNTYLTLFSLYAVNQLGFDPASVAGLFSLQGIANTLIKVPIGRASDRIGRKTILLTTFIMVIFIYLLLSFAEYYYLVGFGVVIFGLAWGSRATVEWAFLTSTVKPEIKNIAVSYMEGFWDIGGSLGSFLAGLLSGYLAVPQILLLMAALNLPAIPAILMIEEEDEA
jgi:predicted MFS family arabinose efflux permease